MVVIFLFRYLDLIGLFFLKKYPIGVAKYLSWPETTSLRKMTSFHHIWFIPLLLYILKKRKLSKKAYKISLLVMSICVILGRISTPCHIIKKDVHKI